ncbi:MAG: hypothetical protein COC12_04090 [Rhodobacteraceae bacterium]|nr:MAG: hypothetical protein COC12_04090 [Paracoccaceae bacterium]
MKIGGHETFYPRPGWLTKGLLHLHAGGSGFFTTAEIADALGVGRNMAKSIGWWLHTMGLAERPVRTGPLELSAFGRVIAERDPFMTTLGTWWLIHVTAQTAQTGASLTWFFSHRRPDRFDRSSLVEALSEELTVRRGKTPALKSVQREVATILHAYAVPVPRPSRDPEDNLGCPLQRLDLIRHVRATDRFERSDPTPIPAEAIGLLLSALGISRPTQSLDEGVTLSVPATGTLLVRAGAIIGKNREAFLNIASDAESLLGSEKIAVGFHASERIISLRSARAATWAGLYYDRLEKSSQGQAA